MEKSNFPVLSVLRHNGTRYAPDDPDHNTIVLTAKEAEPLQALNVLGEPEETEPAQTEPATADPGADLTPEQRGEKITASFKDLKPGTDFIQGGNPRVSAVEKAVGFAVTAAEVDAAWQAANPDPASS